MFFLMFYKRESFLNTSASNFVIASPPAYKGVSESQKVKTDKVERQMQRQQ